MAFTAGGAGNKAFSPFTVTTQNPAGVQPKPPPPGTTSFTFGASTGPGGAPPAFNFGAATPASGDTAAVATRLSFAAPPTATTGTIETPSVPPVAQLSTAVTTSTVETPSITPAAQLTTAATQVTTSTTQAVPTNGSQMNFRQLQEAINKWMLDLQDQETIFLEQATKVNAWDRTLIVNGDKIGKLNESISKVKKDHSRLEHALDYLKTQQQEFEAFLKPLEAGLPVNIPVEPEREQLYSLTESVDTQLQQMAEDLKEVIRHINESNKTVDKNDPISQILCILNEHTDALQWVEDNANQVRRSLEDVSKQHRMSKKEQERSLRQMFK